MGVMTMKPEALDALVVDRELGELSPEAADLLDAYLRLCPDARGPAEAMADAVRATRDAVRRFPDLAPVPQMNPATPVFRSPWFARAAAALLVLGTGVGIGRYTDDPGAGTSSPQTVAAPDARAGGPWARYQVAYDTRSGTYTLARNP